MFYSLFLPLLKPCYKGPKKKKCERHWLFKNKEKLTGFFLEFIVSRHVLRFFVTQSASSMAGTAWLHFCQCTGEGLFRSCHSQPFRVTPETYHPPSLTLAHNPMLHTQHYLLKCQIFSRLLRLQGIRTLGSFTQGYILCILSSIHSPFWACGYREPLMKSLLCGVLDPLYGVPMSFPICIQDHLHSLKGRRKGRDLIS